MVTSMILCPVQIQWFSITMQIKGCKPEGDKTCYFQFKRQRSFCNKLVCIPCVFYGGNIEIQLGSCVRQYVLAISSDCQ